MPGCMTLKEIITAMEAGADVIKIFLGSVFGPSFIKAILIIFKKYLLWDGFFG
ncbi:hypothetical protein ES705_00117 [subsurface metagenome]